MTFCHAGRAYPSREAGRVAVRKDRRVAVLSSNLVMRLRSKGPTRPIASQSAPSPLRGG